MAVDSEAAVEELANYGNVRVVQFEERQFPALAIQGDTMHALLSDLSEAQQMLRSGKSAEAEQALADAINRLGGFMRLYEETLGRRGLKLPYVKAES